jgi:hypothetical protein
MEQLLTIISLIVLLALLGIIVAFSPTLVLTEITVLLKSKKPVVHVMALISGIALAVAIVTSVAVTLLQPSTEINIPVLRDSMRGGPFIDLLIGILLCVIGWYGLRRIASHQEKKPSKLSAENLLTTKKLFFFGLAKMATSVSSIIAIVFAARFIKEVTRSSLSQFAAGLWLVAIAVTPFVILALMYYLRPSSFDLLQDKLRQSKSANVQYIVFSLCIALGAALILLAILHRDQSIFSA